MLGNKQNKSNYILGNKASNQPVFIGSKYNKPAYNSAPLSQGVTNIDTNSTSQAIYVPMGLKQAKTFDSKPFNSLEKIRR